MILKRSMKQKLFGFGVIIPNNYWRTTNLTILHFLYWPIALIHLLKMVYFWLLVIVILVIIIKKDYPLDEEICYSISILPSLLKVFEKLIYKRLSNYIKRFLSSVLCGFRKTHNTQHALFKLLHSWQKELD